MRDKKYGFVDKNKYFKKNIAESMKSFAEIVDKGLNNEKREGFHCGELIQIFFRRNHIFSTDCT